MHEQDVRRGNRQRDGREIAQCVVTRVLDQRQRPQRRTKDDQRIAVSRRTGDDIDADHTTAAAAVINHHRLQQGLPQALRNQARSQIGDTTGFRSNNAQRARGITLRAQQRRIV